MTIGDHIPEIVIELLVAYTFLRPEPFTTATQPQTAFLRFLHFVGKTNWNTQPVILNFKDDISSKQFFYFCLVILTNTGKAGRVIRVSNLS